MDAKELRIGNWVEAPKGAKYNGNYIKWSESDFYWCAECVIDYEQFTPIPLTEEILLKCGFENREMIIDLEGCYGSISYYKDEFYVYSGMGDSESYSFTTNKIKHLYQLQNLYFALTGEELNVEL